MGITLIHFIERFSLNSFPEETCNFLIFTDRIIWDSVFFTFSGKAYCIFALLFGFSFFIQDNSQKLKGKDFRGRFAWRLVLLLFIACINSALFPGEILVLYALLGYVMIAMTLAACGEKTNADTPLPDEPPEPVAEQPATDDEWTVLHADDVLLRTEPFTLCEGRTARLELYGYQNGEYDCGVSRIHLLWDDGREENLLISDLGDEVWGADGYTSCWSPENCLETGDYNFDGYRDIGLQLDNPAYNVPFYYWFYDAQTDGFRPYGRWAFALEPDEENEVCICQWHATPEYYTDTYRPDGNGGLYLAQRDTEVYYSADGVKSFTEVYAVNEQPLAYADLDRDSEDEILVLTTSEPDEFAICRYKLEARKYDGTVLFTKEVTPYYTGWDTFFLCYGEDENGVWGADVLRYQTHEDRGVGSCSYDLISYAGGWERYLDGNTITFVLEADGAAPVPDIRRATQAEFVRFREGVASLLEGSSYLLFCSGPAEDPDTQQAVENILAGLDALEARLYSNAG